MFRDQGVDDEKGPVSRLLKAIKGRPSISPTPWDSFFSSAQTQPFGWFVRVTTKTGQQLVGVFAERSSASSFPESNQLYLEEEYRIRPDGSLEEMDNSAGLLINGKEISNIEFFHGTNPEETK